MDADQTTPTTTGGNRRLKLAAVLGAAALALPGGALIGNAFASDGGSSTTAPSQQAPADPGFVQEGQQPDDERRPDGRDCPKDRQGNGGGSGGSGSSTAL
jgi:hypothetical protein